MTNCRRAAARALGGLALLAAIGCQPGPATAPAPSTSALTDQERQHIGTTVEAYFRKAANVPPTMKLMVGELGAAEVPGLLKGQLEVSMADEHQKIPFLVSRDGRFLVRGEFTDMTIDPLKAVAAKIATKGRPVRGAAEAPVTIVAYSDFQCPFCARAYQTVEDQVLKEYAGKVKLVFKHFPLSDIHPWAETAAIAAECGGVQKPDGFWKLYDYLFQHQTDITPDNLKERVMQAATEAGLDATRLGQCIDGKETQATIEADRQEAEALGVQSTPTFFVNGRRIEGAVPYENFKSVLDQELG